MSNIFSRFSNYRNNDNDDNEFVGLSIDFTGPNKERHRLIFFIIFALAHLLFIAFIGQRYQVPELDHLHRYDVTPDSVQCFQFEHEDSETDIISYTYDLEIKVNSMTFTALNLSRSSCNTIARAMDPPFATAIWHHNFMVYQLGKNARLLSYKEQSGNVRDFQTSANFFYYWMLIFLWFGIHRTIINAFKPGSYPS